MPIDLLVHQIINTKQICFVSTDLKIVSILIVTWKNGKKIKTIDNGEVLQPVVQIKSTDTKQLSKNQKEFNRLSEQIEILQKTIEEKSADIDMIVALWNKQIIPIKKQEVEQRVLLVRAISEKAKRQKLGKRPKELVAKVIVNMLDDVLAYSNNEVTEDIRSLYDEWSEMTYDEVQEETTNTAKEFAKQMLKAQLGIEFEDGDFDLSPEEIFEKYQATINSRIEAEKQEEAEYEQARQRKKTKKQLELEEKKRLNEAAEQEIKNKSLRSIYISLAKVLHPDAAGDDLSTAEREELMKQVTVAYEEKDLSTLLRLEMEWIHKQASHLERLSEEKLAVYISVLREQKQELEREYSNLLYNPSLNHLREYTRVKAATAKKKIKQTTEALAQEIEEDKMMIQTIEVMSKAQFMQYIKQQQPDDYMPGFFEW